MFILTSLLPLAQPDLRNEYKWIHNPGHTFPNAMMESEQSRIGKKRRKAVFTAIQSGPVIAGQVGGGTLKGLNPNPTISQMFLLDFGVKKTTTLRHMSKSQNFKIHGNVTTHPPLGLLLGAPTVRAVDWSNKRERAISP